jgi:hypothetical protein
MLTDFFPLDDLSEESVQKILNDYQYLLNYAKALPPKSQRIKKEPKNLLDTKYRKLSTIEKMRILQLRFGGQEFQMDWKENINDIGLKLGLKPKVVREFLARFKKTGMISQARTKRCKVKPELMKKWSS